MVQHGQAVKKKGFVTFPFHNLHQRGCEVFTA